MIKAAIHQPHYFSWLPYFNKIARVDVFIVFDTVQLPMGKSRVLRTKYLDQSGEKWLTIPVGKVKSELMPIGQIELSGLEWQKDHVAKLRNAYARAPHFGWAMEVVASTMEVDSLLLLDHLEAGMMKVCHAFGLGTRLIRASKLLPYAGIGLSEYIIALLQKVGASAYLTGKGVGSKKTVDEGLFFRAGIDLEYQDYTISEYPQLHGRAFVPEVSVLDTMFMLGPSAGVNVTGERL